MYLSFFEKLNLYAFAISRRFASAELIPAKIPAATIGITIRKVMKTGTESRLIQISARIMNDTTGVVLTAVKKGLNILFKMLENEISIPRIVPDAIPRRYPPVILKNERKQVP